MTTPILSHCKHGNQFLSQHLKSLIGSMPNRLKAVINKNSSVAVGPGNAQFMCIRQVSLRRGT